MDAETLKVKIIIIITTIIIIIIYLLTSFINWMTSLRE